MRSNALRILTGRIPLALVALGFNGKGTWNTINGRFMLWPCFVLPGQSQISMLRFAVVLTAVSLRDALVVSTLLFAEDPTVPGQLPVSLPQSLKWQSPRHT